MLKHVLNTTGLTLSIAETLVKDLTPAQMTTQPHGLINHPCWTLGHLVTSAHAACGLIGVESTLPDGWAEKFKAGTPPDPDPAANPGRDELLAALKDLHAKLAAALPSVDPSVLEAEHPDEKTRTYFPTVGDMVVFMLTAHEMDHLGQVAAWRRAMGLKPAR